MEGQKDSSGSLPVEVEIRDFQTAEEAGQNMPPPSS